MTGIASRGYTGPVYRLLIADDEEEIRRGLSNFFPWEEIGYSVVHVAADGGEALHAIRGGGVDVALCDIRMPSLSGLELARTVFEEHLGVSIVLLSAYRDFEYAQQAIQYEVKSYILKPTHHGDLRAAFLKLKRELDRRVPKVLREEEDDTAGRGESRAAAAVGRVQEYVRREYAHASLDRAARVVHLNPQYLSRIFRSHTGENFNEFLIRIKMEKAAQLLGDISYRTYGVSEMVGYSNPKNFTRTFKRFYGMSPREYRQSNSRK